MLSNSSYPVKSLQGVSHVSEKLVSDVSEIVSIMSIPDDGDKESPEASDTDFTFTSDVTQ
jgi:hypothetical protein